MVDIRTYDEVKVDGKYLVAVVEDSGGFQAAVVSVYSPSGQIVKAMAEIMNGDVPDDWVDVKESPRTIADTKFTAVGQAIDKFKEDKEKDNNE